MQSVGADRVLFLAMKDGKINFKGAVIDLLRVGLVSFLKPG
jgi:hypothetical protein